MQGRMGNGLIKAVFFDYDGVLTTDKTGSLTTNRYLSQAAGIDFSKIRAAFSQYSRAKLLTLRSGSKSVANWVET